MTKPVILTGLRANNDLTLGNYFGGILPMIEMAKHHAADFQINMFIPDLHSFTTPIDHDKLQEQIMHNARLFVAAGLPLDYNNIHLYRQSYIPAHSELTWILDCFAGMGEMSRMTQFKEKTRADTSEKDAVLAGIKQALEEYKDQIDASVDDIISRAYDDSIAQVEAKKEMSASVGLFNYPVLMAADILLYGAKYIPVGEDQTQHLEFTRDIAERMNKKFGDIFIIPEAVPKQYEFFGKENGLRIMDLVTPTKKMSKSDESGRGVIFLGDDPAIAAKKIMSAATDDLAEVHYDKVNQPGISNMLEILALLRGQKLSDTIQEFEGQTRYGDFKKVVADTTATFLADFQARLAAVDNNAIIHKLETSEATMRSQASATLLRTQQAVGLRPKGIN